MKSTPKDISVVIFCLVVPFLLTGIVYLSHRIYSSIEIKKEYEALNLLVSNPEVDYPEVRKLLGSIIGNLKNDPAFEGDRISADDFSIGNAIFVYEYQNGRFQKIRISYPLFIENRVVATAEWLFEGCFVDSTFLVPALNEHLLQSVAIIYDAENCYLYNGSDFYLFTPITPNFPKHGTIENAENLSALAANLVLNKVVPVASLEYKP